MGKIVSHFSPLPHPAIRLDGTGFKAWRDIAASFDRVSMSIAGGKYIVKIITNDMTT
jgi:hypothetical protein